MRNVPTLFSAFLCLLFSGTSISSFAQVRVSNIQHQPQANTIVITYDINGADASVSYDVELSSSFNSYQTTLLKVEGDVGPSQQLQNGKQTIVWHYEEELTGPLNGLDFRVSITPSQASQKKSFFRSHPVLAKISIGVGISGGLAALYFWLIRSRLPEAPDILDFN